MLGRASDSPSEFFKGDIFDVAVYNYVLAASQVASLAQPQAGSAASSVSVEDFTVGGERRTLDGRLCLSPCSMREPSANAVFSPEAESRRQPAVALSCDDSALLSAFNGPTQSRFRVLCPHDCQRSKAPVRGSKVYAPQSSVCKAAMHAGMLDAEGGEVTLVLHNGIASYKASKGQHGKRISRFFFSTE